MPRSIVTLFAVAFGLVVTAGCGSVTGTDYLKEFTVGTMDPTNLVPQVEATSALRILYIQGLIQTPSPCYQVNGDFDKSGAGLTLRVRANETTGTGCDAALGGFRYTAVVGDLKRRTYQLRVIHEIDGSQDKEFNLTVAVVQ